MRRKPASGGRRPRSRPHRGSTTRACDARPASLGLEGGREALRIVTSSPLAIVTRTSSSETCSVAPAGTGAATTSTSRRRAIACTSSSFVVDAEVDAAVRLSLEVRDVVGDAGRRQEPDLFSGLVLAAAAGENEQQCCGEVASRGHTQRHCVDLRADLRPTARDRESRARAARAPGLQRIHPRHDGDSPTGRRGRPSARTSSTAWRITTASTRSPPACRSPASGRSTPSRGNSTVSSSSPSRRGWKRSATTGAGRSRARRWISRCGRRRGPGRRGGADGAAGSLRRLDAGVDRAAAAAAGGPSRDAVQARSGPLSGRPSSSTSWRP